MKHRRAKQLLAGLLTAAMVMTSMPVSLMAQEGEIPAMEEVEEAELQEPELGEEPAAEEPATEEPATEVPTAVDQGEDAVAEPGDDSAVDTQIMEELSDDSDEFLIEDEDGDPEELVAEDAGEAQEDAQVEDQVEEMLPEIDEEPEAVEEEEPEEALEEYMEVEPEASMELAEGEVLNSKTRYMLPGWDGYIDPQVEVYVINSVDPDGGTEYCDILYVTVENDESEILTEMPVQENGWHYSVGEPGVVVLRVWYIGPDEEEDYYDLTLYVNEDVYEVRLRSADGTYTRMPGQAIELEAVGIHRYIDDNGRYREDSKDLSYTWSVDSEQEKYATITWDADNSSSAALRFNSENDVPEWNELLEDGGFIDQPINVKVCVCTQGVYGPVQTGGTDEVEFRVQSSYFQIEPAWTNPNLGVGRLSQEITPQIMKYTGPYDEPEIINSDTQDVYNLYYQWNFDERAVQVLRVEENDITGEKTYEAVAKEETCEEGTFVFKRLQNWDTEITLSAEWTVDNGEGEDSTDHQTEVHYQLDSIAYDIITEHDQVELFTDTPANAIQPITFDTNVLGENWQEVLKADLTVGVWNNSRDNWEIYYDEDDYDRSWDEYGNLSVTLKQTLLEELAEYGYGNSDIRILLRIYLKDEEINEENWITEADSWVHVRDAREEYDHSDHYDLLPGWDFFIDVFNHAYVENYEHPDGEDVTYRVMNVRVKENSPVAGGNKDVVSINEERDGSGSGGWRVRAENIGEAELEVAYLDLDENPKTYECTVTVDGDVYEASIRSDMDMHTTSPGGAFYLKGRAVHKYFEENGTYKEDADGLQYHWVVYDNDQDGEHLAEIEVNDDPRSVRVQVKSLPVHGQQFHDSFRVGLFISEQGASDPIADAVAYVEEEFFVDSSYEEYLLGTLDTSIDMNEGLAALHVGEKLELSQMIVSDDYSYDPKYHVTWHYDEEAVNIQKKSYTGSSETISSDTMYDYTGEVVFSITRLTADDTDISMEITWEDKDGNERRETRSFHLNRKEYSEWFDESQGTTIYTDDEEGKTYQLNMSDDLAEAVEKKLVDIYYALVFFNTDGDRFYPIAGLPDYEIYESTTQITLSGSELAGIENLDHVEIHAQAYHAGGDDIYDWNCYTSTRIDPQKPIKEIKGLEGQKLTLLTGEVYDFKTNDMYLYQEDSTHCSGNTLDNRPGSYIPIQINGVASELGTSCVEVAKNDDTSDWSVKGLAVGSTSLMISYVTEQDIENGDEGTEYPVSVEVKDTVYELQLDLQDEDGVSITDGKILTNKNYIGIPELHIKTLGEDGNRVENVLYINSSNRYDGNPKSYYAYSTESGADKKLGTRISLLYQPTRWSIIGIREGETTLTLKQTVIDLSNGQQIKVEGTIDLSIHDYFADVSGDVAVALTPGASISMDEIKDQFSLNIWPADERTMNDQERYFWFDGRSSLYDLSDTYWNRGPQTLTIKPADDENVQAALSSTGLASLEVPVAIETGNGVMGWGIMKLNIHDHAHEGVLTQAGADGALKYWHCSDCEKNYADQAGTVEISAEEITQANAALAKLQALKGTGTDEKEAVAAARAAYDALSPALKDLVDQSDAASVAKLAAAENAINNEQPEQNNPPTQNNPPATEPVKDEATIRAEGAAAFALNVKNGTTVPLQVKKKYKQVKIANLAAGDSIASVVSSKTKVVKASVSGNSIVLKAQKKTGTAVITVRTAWGGVATFKAKVKTGKVKTSKVIIDPSAKKVTLQKGQTYQVTASVTPITSPEKIKFSSSNKKIATVTSKGLIKAKKAGKVKITVKSGSKKKVITVTVK